MNRWIILVLVLITMLFGQAAAQRCFMSCDGVFQTVAEGPMDSMPCHGAEPSEGSEDEAPCPEENLFSQMAQHFLWNSQFGLKIFDERTMVDFHWESLTQELLSTQNGTIVFYEQAFPPRSFAALYIIYDSWLI